VSALCVVAEILAQRLSRELLNLSLPRLVEQAEHSIGKPWQLYFLREITGQQSLRLGDQCILGANCGFELSGSVVGHSGTAFLEREEPVIGYAR
jgi:hypothetical protein